ncbi:protein FAR1-RELATED SEQUENCE 5-like [Aegilops tauschii subsp. strangulata]|uniref:protein FAR1-RELATED SEQUENCE 5-like n=1 Tax=Aegilops tauschii subsp. strangulata TaxID=200361 RepID=UPI001ABD3B47|nr:protein FAR1-RELATED SEQUENCE 5-like [Aegilops tauschii subsp. strangulata]
MSADFNDCIDFSFTPEEFESKWTAFVLKWPVVGGTHFDKLYEYRSMFVPCYLKHRFFPFLQSTQCSEGINAVLKRYVNPHNSVLNFVKQYEKIQTHVLVREGGNDYRTYHLHAELWSNFPIEKQAYNAYTRDIYHKFHTEFELIGRYNVRPHGDHAYELYPNNEGWVPSYGDRSYFVTVEAAAEEYKCECYKMCKDGMLCCHILNCFTHLGVDVIPGRYILRRWTQQAITGAGSAVEADPDEMPPASKKQLRHTNLSMDFASIARVASGSDATTAILKKHMRATHTELNHFNKCKKKKAKMHAHPGHGAPPTATSARMPPPDSRATPSVDPTPVPSGSTPIAGVPRDPPKSTTKGRAKSKRIESALELHPKRKNKCSFCSSVDHNAANCPGRLV